MTRKDISRRLARVTRELSQLLEHALTPSVAVVKSKFEQAILEALSGGEPMPGKLVAKRAGYSYGGRLRSVLADMTRRGMIAHTADGYQLVTSRPERNGRTAT